MRVVLLLNKSAFIWERKRKKFSISVCSHAHITKLPRIVRAEKRERNNEMIDRQQSLQFQFNRRRRDEARESERKKRKRETRKSSI